MSKPITLIIMTAFLFLSALPAIAQPHPRPEERLGKLAEDLDLSDSQLSLIQAIIEAAESSCSDLRRGPEHYECMQNQHEDIETQIEALLTDEQKELFDELRENGPVSGEEGQKPVLDEENQDSDNLKKICREFKRNSKKNKKKGKRKK